MPGHHSTRQIVAVSVGPVQYLIRVDGHLGACLLSAFPELVAREVAQTVLTGVLDLSALYGVLAQIEMLGLDLVEVQQVPAPAPPRPGDPEQTPP
jgi:hypothetical protein